MNLEKSLVFSYLRHIKKCKIIQTEWFPCIDEWNIHSRKGEELLKTAKNYFRNKYRIAIFQDIKSLKDINGKDIVDAFGISFNEDYTEKIYGVCSYIFKDDYDLNIKYIIDKIVLMAIYFISCFNKIEGNIIFMCPSVDFELIKKISVFYEDIKEIFAQVKCDFEVTLYLNEEFNEEVIEKIHDISKTNTYIGNNEKYMKYTRFHNSINNLSSEKSNMEFTRETVQQHNDNEMSKENETEFVENKTIEIEGIKFQEDSLGELNEEDGYISNNKQPVRDSLPKLNVLIDDESNEYNFNKKDILESNKTNEENTNQTTSYYMNQHNVKTQFSVDVNSFNKVLEERKKRIVKELIESKTNRSLNEKYADIKISELVKNEFNRLFETQKIPIGEIRKLQELEYSQKTFGIKYPVLREVNMNKSLEEQRRDENGIAIYYGFISTIYDKDYYICSAWTEEHRIKFLRYLSFFK